MAEAKIKALQNKIPGAEAEGLERAYLKKISPAGIEFSSFAKVEARLRGRTVKLDAILHFAPPADFSLTVMGPLMAPLWKARASGDVLDMNAIALAGIDSATFSYWASLMTTELRDWFSGKTIAGGKFDDGWDSVCFNGDGKEVCLDGDRVPGEIRPEVEKKLMFKPSHYFMHNLYLFPNVMEFKLPAVSVRITLDNTQMNFNGVNALGLPE